jgi:hypothetical protein
MTADEIAKAAWKGNEIEQFADLEDLHLHTCLLRVYRDFKDGKIGKEAASALKKRMTATWESDKKTFAQWTDMLQKHVDAIKACEGLNPEKAQSETECIMILAQMVAACTGDYNLTERMRRKWMK